jgi:valyl-tRNA synthetase
MPFITEEIWSVFSQDKKSIMIDAFPTVNDEEIDGLTEDHMDKVIGTIKAVRNFRSEHQINPSKIIDKFFVRCKNQSAKEILETNKTIILNLSKVSNFSFDPSPVDIKKSARLLFKDVEIFLPLTSVAIILEEEKDRLRKKTVKLEKELTVVEKKLGNQDFLTKAPREVVEKVEAKAKEIRDAIKKIRAGADEITKMKGASGSGNV